MNIKSPFYTLKKKLESDRTKARQWQNFLKRIENFKFNKISNKYKLFVSVLAIYAILAGLVGFVVFRSSSKPDTAKASESALISSSMRFQNEKKFKQGDEINVVVTLQNTSTIESINTLHLELLSTRNLVEWKKAQNLNNNTQSVIISNDGKGFNLPSLSSNERVEYLFSGYLTKTPNNFLTILGKLRFLNKQGKVETETNRIFTLLEPLQKPTFSLMSLTTNQEKYKLTDGILFSLNKKESANSSNSNNLELGENSASNFNENTDNQSDSNQAAETINTPELNNSKTEKKQITKGQIYITNQYSKELVQTLDCEVDIDRPCQVQAINLQLGKYSAVFISDKDEVLSDIVWFEVFENDQNLNTQINPDVKLKLPFGVESINGRVDILAEKVLSQNQEFKSDLKCIFEIWQKQNNTQNNQKIAQKETLINKERNCLIQLGPNDLPASGLYTVKLANSPAEILVTYLKDKQAELRLKNQDFVFFKDKGVNLGIEKILQDKTQINNSNLELPGGIINNPRTFSSSSSSSSNNLELPSPVRSSSSINRTETGSIDLSFNNKQNLKLDFVNAQDFSRQATGSIDLTEKSSSSSSSSVSSSSSIQNIQNVNNNQNLNDLGLLNGQNLTIYLYHPQTGEFREIFKSLIQNNFWQGQIASQFFDKSSFYEVVGKLDNGSYTEFLTINFQSQEIAPNNQAIEFDPKIWQAGQKILTRLANIKDKSGNLIGENECKSRLYLPGFRSVDNKEFLEQKGKIQQGVCEIYWESGMVEKSGTGVITILDQNDNLIQSQIVKVYPGQPVDFGGLNFEYEPLRKNFANRLIIGPVTDIFGNLVSHSGYTLEIENKEGKINKIESLKIEEGFVEISIPASYLNSDNLSFRFLTKEGYEILSKVLVPVNQENKNLLLPSFPKTLKDTEILKVGISNLDLPQEFSTCKLEFFKKINLFESIEVSYDQLQKKCQFDWDLPKLRNQSRALIRLTAGDKIFNSILNLESTQAANIFSIFPQFQSTDNGQRVKLLITPLYNKYGQTVQTGKVHWKINNKRVSTDIQNGLTSLNLNQIEINNNDFKVNLGKKYLDLDIDVKAGTNSVNKERNIKIFINKEELDIENQVLEFYQFDNILAKGMTEILQFKTSHCRVSAILNQTWTDLKTYAQDDLCLVQISPESTGKLELVFRDQNNFIQEKLNLEIKDDKYPIAWCVSELGNGCPVQIYSPVLDKIKATLYDQGKEYTFESDSLENVVKIEQKGLNPKAKYLIKIEYQNLEKFKVIHYKQVLGKQIMMDNNLNQQVKD